MFFKEIRWEDAAKLYEGNKPFFFLPYDVMPIMVANPQEQKHKDGVSFLALLEAQVLSHGKIATWTKEGKDTYSGDKCYKIIDPGENLEIYCLIQLNKHYLIKNQDTIIDNDEIYPLMELPLDLDLKVV